MKKYVKKKVSYLALVRHGESTWNALGQWTGWTDINLSDTGRQEARQAALVLKDIRFNVAHTSDLGRAQETLTIILKELNLTIPIKKHPAIKERNYGSLTGKNKWKIKEEYGEEQFMRWRRSWDHPVPEGESLKDVHARVVPYYKKYILPDLLAGKHVLVAAHGNSLRALVKHLEHIADQDIPHLEIATGEVYLYHIEAGVGKIIKKEIRAANPKRGKQ